MAPLNIIVVGAGIGGPAAALGLARNGHQVTLYERSTTTSEVGYAFRITANSDLCLRFLGIDTQAGGAVAGNSVRILNSEGKIVREVKENADPERVKKGTSVFAYRPQLNQQLMVAALAQGVQVKTGVKVASVDTERTSIILEDGSEITADLIIAADGVHSAIRSHVVDSSQFAPQPSTGHNAFRFMISRELLENDPEMSSVVTPDARMFTWSDYGKRILVYPVDFDRQFNVTCTHSAHLSNKEATAENDSEAAIAYNQKVSLEKVLKIYRDLGDLAVRFLSLADPEGFRVWKMLDMEEIPTWSKQNTVLLGDACHPVSPFGFSGASMAIEDAATLAMLLPGDTARQDIPSRLKLYEEIRKPRVGRVRETGRAIANGGDKDKKLMEEYKEFVSSHDAIEYASGALSRHLEAIKV